MGSFCSTSKALATGRRRGVVDGDTDHAAPVSGEEGPSGAAAANSPPESPLKGRSRRYHQKHGSGRWKRKKGGGGDGNDAVWGCEGADVPGRMCGNGASKISCLYTQQGKKGTNQDAMLVWEDFCSRSDTVFCGVFDGHGPYGHMVARKVRDTLPLILDTRWKASSNGDQETASPGMDDDELCDSLEAEKDDERYPEMFSPLKQSMLKAFKLMDKELKLHQTIDCFCSGTTTVTLIKQGQHLVVGNVGDSRAVLATRDKDDNLVALQLTVDLKPDLPKEAARIHQCKGRVFALQDEPEVARVWLPNSDSPGLAMARAFGDFCLKDFGLISVPDVYYHLLTERDEFVVLATDGVWDVLSNKEVVDIVASAPGRATAARALVDCAVRAWRLKYPTSKNDDCAVVCLFLDNVSPSAATIEESNLKTKNDEAIEKVSASETQGSSFEIVPVPEPSENKVPTRSQSRRSLAEFISTAQDDEEWSALEGVTRVNSLLSLPRFLSSDHRSTSWRKWL